MEKHQKSSNIQIEINNLIDDAVNHALARRNQNLDVEAALSDDEAGNIAGGQITSVKSIAIAGYKPIWPPTTLGYITVGLIAPDYGTLKF
jgi:hypothetical protein